MGLTKPRAAQIFNLDYKQATRVVTTTNITLAGSAPSSVDGVSLSVNDRILVTGQSTGSQNGLYRVSTLGSGSNGTWTRTTDGNDTGEIEAGMIVMVTEGVIYADTQWKLITDDPITIGTTALTFTQNYSANSITGGTSNVRVFSNANVTVSSAGTANVLTVSSTGTVTTGTASVTGNITGGNLLTGGVISATGAINTDANIVAGTNTKSSPAIIYTNSANSQYGALLMQKVGVERWLIGSDNSTGNGNVVIRFNATTNYVTVTEAGAMIVGGNVTGGNILTGGLISAPGNVTGGNLTTAGQVSAIGNITASYFLGNVACASGIYASRIFNGTSEANIGTSGGNANISIGGTSNVVVFATTGEYVTGLLSVTGNITGGNITIPGSANISTFIGNVFFGSVPAQPTYYNIAPLNLNNSLASATKVQLNLINTGGGGGAGSAIDFYTYQISVAAANAEARIAGIDDGNYSAYLSLQTKTPGSTGTNSLVERVKIDSTGVSVVANITGGNISATNHTGTNVSVTGTVTAASTVGGVITGTSTSVTGTQTAASTVGGVITGTSLSVGGNVTGANLVTTGLVTVTGNVYTGNILTNGYYYANGAVFGGGGGGGGTPGGANTYVQFNDNGVFNGSAGFTFIKTTNALSTTGAISTTGTVTAASTVGGVIIGSSLSVSGTVTGSQFNGSGAGLTSIPGANVTGTVPNATTATYVTGLTSANVTTALGFTPYNSTNPSGYQTTSGTVATVSTAAQPNITSVGSSLTTSGALTVNSSNGVTAIINGGTNGGGNIGASGAAFNTVFAKATTAQYADLAEMYAADTDYAPGTVVEFGGNYEITVTTTTHATQVAGIISTNPAYLMNSTQAGEHSLEVALVGRVPCSVVGTICKGDRLVSSNIPGVAQALDINLYQPGCIVGKALEEYNSPDPGVIEVAVGRL